MTLIEPKKQDFLRNPLVSPINYKPVPFFGDHVKRKTYQYDFNPKVRNVGFSNDDNFNRTSNTFGGTKLARGLV